MPATLDQLRERFMQLSDRERLHMLERNVATVHEIDTELGLVLEAQIQERKELEKAEQELLKSRRCAFRWLQTSQTRAIKGRRKQYRSKYKRRSSIYQARIDLRKELAHQRNAMGKLRTAERRANKHRIRADEVAVRAAERAAERAAAKALKQQMESTQMDESITTCAGFPAELDELISEVQAEPTPPVRKRRRAPRGTKCPAWIEKDLDALIWETVHFEDDTQPEPSVDPPVEVSDLDAGAGGDEVMPVVVQEEPGATPMTAAADPSPLGDSAWGLLCDGVEDFSPSDLQSLSDALAQHSELNAIALVAAIGRAKVTMGGISPWVEPEAPVSIAAGDLLVLLRTALKRVG